MECTSRIRFFAIALLLEALSDSGAMGRLSEIYSSYSDKQRAAGLVLGYKIIIESVLYRQIDLIVTCPEILHLQADLELHWWWENSEDKSARRLEGITEVDAPKSTLVASYVNDLLLRVVRSGNRLEKFTEAATEVSSFAQVILSIARNCRVSVKGGGDSALKRDIDWALRLCVAEYLYDLLYDKRDRTLRDAFDYTGNETLKWVEGSILEGIGEPAVETSRDGLVSIPRRRRGPYEYSGLGINAALEIATQKLTGQRPLVGRDDIDLPPAGDIFGDLLEEFLEDEWPSMTYGLTFQNGVPEKELREIMAYETSPSDAQRRLKTLLGENAFLVSGAGSNAEFHFRVLIEGLVRAEPPDKRVEVLKIEHSGGPNEAHPPVSLAVLVGRYWQVFYYIDAVGRMKSGVWPFLDGLGERVRITEVRGVSTEYLLSLCDRAFQYVTRQWKAQKDLNTHLRGVIPELLAGLLLGRLNYSGVRTSFELKRIGEIDAIGYKESGEGGECKVVEVKRRPRDQIQLRAEIEKFRGKVQRIEQNREAVSEALGCPGSIETVSGLFISMAEIGDLSGAVSKRSELVMGLYDPNKPKAEFQSFLDGLDVDFWDYDDFNRELEAAELPELPIRLLEHARLTWLLTGADRTDEIGMWDVLGKAVEKDNWQWPESSEAVTERLEDELRCD
ncbi:MAG: hypothetical protein OXC95_11750 [Dehalococcoidia bacterium]|nr:hypothetical protein [Dehalococcoidia bacterium]